MSMKATSTSSSRLRPTSLSADSLIGLSDSERSRWLGSATIEELAGLLYDWEFWSRANQREPEGAWRIWLVLSGRGFGKTRIGAEWIRQQVKTFEFVNLIAKSRDEYRDVMIEGESGIMAICPDGERPVYRKSLRRLDWPNGAKTLCFTAEEPEQLRGPQHQRLWGDEVAKWPYMVETWEMATLGLRLPPDPRALLTTTPKPVPLLRQLVENPNVVITKGSSYENRANLDPSWYAELIQTYEGTRLGPAGAGGGVAARRGARLSREAGDPRRPGEHTDQQLVVAASRAWITGRTIRAGSRSRLTTTAT